VTGCVRLEAYEAGGLKRPKGRGLKRLREALKEEKRPRRFEEATRPAFRQED
jgi:hypothetical protein